MSILAQLAFNNVIIMIIPHLKNSNKHIKIIIEIITENMNKKSII